MTLQRAAVGTYLSKFTLTYDVVCHNCMIVFSEPTALSDEPRPHAARHRLRPARAAQVLVQYLARQQQQVLAARQADAAQERLRPPRGRKCAVAYLIVCACVRSHGALAYQKQTLYYRYGCLKNILFWEFSLYNLIIHVYSDNMHPHTSTEAGGPRRADTTSTSAVVT